MVVAELLNQLFRHSTMSELANRLELTAPLMETDESSLSRAALVGSQYIGGALMLRNLLDSDDFLEGSAKESWADLKVRVADSSYFACMSIPLARQLVELQEHLPGIVESQISIGSEQRRLRRLSGLRAEAQSIREQSVRLAESAASLSARIESSEDFRSLGSWFEDFYYYVTCLALIHSISLDA